VGKNVYEEICSRSVIAMTITSRLEHCMVVFGLLWRRSKRHDCWRLFRWQNDKTRNKRV